VLAQEEAQYQYGPPSQEELENARSCEEVYGAGSDVCNADMDPETGTPCPAGQIPFGEGCVRASNADTPIVENPYDNPGPRCDLYEFREDALEQEGITCSNLPSREGLTPADLPAARAAAEQRAAQYASESEANGGVTCARFVSAAGNPSQVLAQQFYDFQATPEQQASLDADGDGFACDDLETGKDDLGETDAKGEPDANRDAAQAEQEASAEREDLCADMGFARKYAGLPVSKAPDPEAPSVDPKDTGIVCGHILAKHGYIPSDKDADPEGKTLPNTGGPELSMFPTDGP
jgi:hypothetical protein